MALSSLLAGIDPGMAVVSGIVLVALFLFYTEIVPIDITAIGILVALVVFQRWTRVTPEDALTGFASKATITIIAFFIISEGVRETGLVQMISRKIASFTGSSEKKQVFAVTSISGTFSGFINNVAVVGVMIPVVNDLAEKAGVSPSKLLMPMSFVAISAGQLTLIASTDNLVISDISTRLLQHPIGMFELTAVGFSMMVVAILYFITVGYRLVPDKGESGNNLLRFDLKDYLTELTIPEGSSFVGKTIEDVMEELEVELEVLQITRNGQQHVPRQAHRLQPGDVLEVKTDRESLMNVIDRKDIDLVPETTEEHEELEEKEHAYTLVSAMIPPNSSLVDETLGGLNFRQHYNASVLAIKREAEVIRSKMKDARLRAGDVLLLQTSEENLDNLAENTNFVLAHGSERMSYRSEKAPIAAGIVAGVIAITALGYLPVEIAGLAGVFGMVLSGCIAPRKMYESVDWNIIFLISGVIPLGIAMAKTGMADALAGALTSAGSSLSPVAVLVLVYLASQLTTSLMNDNAAMVLLAPIAIEVARNIGAEPFSFLMAVLFAGGTAVLTPMGFQTNLMIFGPGDYSFKDFLKVGLPLNILLSIVVLTGIVTIWGV
ncbi:MAG: SLC13 family permease [Candidatus Nanohaloarchaea archaeon]|nr:SLC13 family permease [Candidatus Nanohaloarchaea archaeon]